MDDTYINQECDMEIQSVTKKKKYAGVCVCVCMCLCGGTIINE